MVQATSSEQSTSWLIHWSSRNSSRPPRILTIRSEISFRQEARWKGRRLARLIIRREIVDQPPFQMRHDCEPCTLDEPLYLGIDGISPSGYLCNHIVPFLVSRNDSSCYVVECLLLGHTLSAEDVDDVVVMAEL